MKFKVGDVVTIDDNAKINAFGADKEIAFDLSGAEWTVIGITPEDDNLLLDGADNQDGIGYDQQRFELVEPKGGWFATDEEVAAMDHVEVTNDLTDGYYEPCSAYRACQDEKGDWAVEAVRVKLVCIASDEDEAHRIADALNQTKDD